jgi:hypothetical protein
MSLKRIVFFIIIATCLTGASVFFSGCGSKNATSGESDKTTAPEADSGNYIEYGDAKYQLYLKRPAVLLADFSDPESRMVLSFPESYTTGTNLGIAQIRLDVGRRTCDDFGSSEDPVISWHYSKSLSPSNAFPEKMTVNGLEFKRLKCSDAAMSHVADSLVYVTEHNGQAFSLNLYFRSANPEVYDESIRPRVYEPSAMEKIYLDVLSSIKFKD